MDTSRKPRGHYKKDSERKSTTLPIRLSPNDRCIIEKKAQECSMSITQYARGVLTNGYIQVVQPKVEIEEIRKLYRELLSLKTNFNRIANLIKHHSPELTDEVAKTVRQVQSVLDKFSL